MITLLTLLFGFIPINIIKIFLLNSLGHKISYKSKIGISVLLIKRIELNNNAKINNFNFIKIKKLVLKDGSFIGRFNIINGPFEMSLDSKAGISKQNKIRRSNPPISYGNAVLSLGYNSFIVSNHFLDLTRSIEIGENSIIAGIGTQLWTHGYYHSDKGSQRIRIDGEIIIKNNVYVGSSCIFNPGVVVNEAIHIGAGSTVSKNLVESGMYVSQSLRYIDNDMEKVKSKLDRMDDFQSVEEVYIKNV
ncbi:acyltransferase [Sediminicola sp. 1XM1-17]|uniref:acyltransferase n=1 Tax=Sediminicola sp. 1XM1-17 TaxID=3127702 RepID=UPI0030773FF0